MPGLLSPNTLHAYYKADVQQTRVSCLVEYLSLPL